MEGSEGGISAPSYKDAVSSKGKTMELNNKGVVGEKNRDDDKGTEGTKIKLNSSIRDKEEEDKTLGSQNQGKRDHASLNLKSLQE